MDQFQKAIFLIEEPSNMHRLERSVKINIIDNSIFLFMYYLLEQQSLDHSQGASSKEWSEYLFLCICLFQQIHFITFSISRVWTLHAIIFFLNFPLSIEFLPRPVVLLILIKSKYILYKFLFYLMWLSWNKCDRCYTCDIDMNLFFLKQ